MNNTLQDPSKISRSYRPESIKKSELLSIFPQAKRVIQQNIVLVEEKISTAYQHYEQYAKEVAEKATNDFSLWFWLEVGKTFLLGEVISLERRVKQLQRILFAKEIQKKYLSNQNITDRDIENAKTVHIESIIPINGAGFALCPFHEEKTPSFKIYKDNRWYCFGCCMGGDVIDIVKKLYSLSFIEAVKFLLRYG